MIAPALLALAASACGPLPPADLPHGGSEGSEGETDSGPDDGPTVDAGDSTGSTGAADTASTGGSASVCGNGLVEPGEPCDDGNEVDFDGCQSDCTITAGARAVTVGWEHTCALTWSQAVHCWGHNNNGQLGLGHTADIGDDEPASAGGPVDVGGPVVALVAGAAHTCALLDDGRVRCWGLDYGALGQPGLDEWIGDDETPAQVEPVDVGGAVVELFAGGEHTCVLLDHGGLRCWGNSNTHPIGYPGGLEVGVALTPAEAGDMPVPEPVVDVALGHSQTCVVGASGAAYCWGENQENVLSVPAFDTWLVPDALSAVVVDAGVSVVSVRAGLITGGVITIDQAIRTWGYLEVDGHALGPLQVGQELTPAEAGDVSFGEPVLELQLGEYGGCARGASGVKCWGTTLGYPEASFIDDDTPEERGLLDVGAEVVGLAQTDAAARHRCVVTATAGVRCWGHGEFGQLGHGTTETIGDVHPPSFYGDVPFL